MTWHIQFQLDTNAEQSGVHNESFSVRVTIVITTSWQNVCAVSVCICPLSLRFPSRCFPLVLLSLCKCLVMFCPRSRKGVPKLFTPNRQTRFVLEFVLNAGYCNSNSSVRPRERWVVGAYATWPRPERAPGLQATLLMLVLHLLVQCTCRIFATTWCCRKTRSNRKWHHGVSSLRSTRQQFSCGVVQQNYAEWIRGRLVDELFTRMRSSSRSLSYIRSALRLLEAPVGVLAETTKIICGAMKLSGGSVRFKPRADAEQTSVNCARKNFGRSDIADNWLVTRHFCFKCVQKCAHADSGKSLSGARRGKGECTPSGYVNSVPSRSTSPLTVGRRCICRLQDEHCAAPAFSGFEWETFACFPHVLCTEGLAYLKTAAVRRNLKEPANGNACVSAWWANAALERLRTRQRYSIEEIRAELPPSHT